MTDPEATSAPRERDPDLISAEVAIQRAALRAREKARRHGVAVVYSEGGVIKREYPPADPPEGRRPHDTGR